MSSSSHIPLNNIFILVIYLFNNSPLRRIKTSHKIILLEHAVNVQFGLKAHFKHIN